MKSSETITSLFEKYLSRKCTEAELQQLLNYFDDLAEESGLRSLLGTQLEQSVDERSTIALRGTLGKLDHNIHAALNGQRQIKAKAVKFKLYKRFAVAAVVATALFGAGLFYFNYNKADVDKSIYVNDIPPGNVGATLILADGKKIRLTNAVNGELAKESGVVISKTADGKLVYQIKERRGLAVNKINVLSTAKGETYQVNLPDGTVVMLNAESSLSYPASFAGMEKRIVTLKGEAYLEVAKDKKHPFVVKAADQEVQVLGTHFNVSAYAGEPVKTALAEGIVKVSIGSGFKIINPGQQTLVENNSIKVEAADLEETLAWKDGDFNFNSETIVSIMNTLSRWYDIEVSYQGRFNTDTYSGRISCSKNISEILKKLEKTKTVHFKVEGRRVTVTE